MEIEIHTAKPEHLAEVLGWLKEEQDASGAGFYCNRNVIAKSFATSDALCAASTEGILGFIVVQMSKDGGDIHIVEVKPVARSQGIGSRLFLAAIDALRQRGAKYIDAECTSKEGDLLCRRYGFEDYIDPRNQREEWDNPALRLYLTKWRPPPPNLFL